MVTSAGYSRPEALERAASTGDAPDVLHAQEAFPGFVHPDLNRAASTGDREFPVLRLEFSRLFGRRSLFQETTSSMLANPSHAELSLRLFEVESTKRSSIYDAWSSRKRYGILFLVSTATLIVPFCDTIYLPAIPAMEEDLDTSEAMVAASVAIYMFMVGFASLVWGPSSDRFGRKINYVIAMLAFLATSLACIFAPDVNWLIALRALQGTAVACFVSVGGGIIADVFPPKDRGAASGLFMIALLVGPVIGPLLGGGLAEAFGWRSTFVFLSIFAGGLVLPLLLWMLPETHQYMKLLQLQSSDRTAAADIQEADEIKSNPPVFEAPWVPLRYLAEPEIMPHAIVAFVTFGAMFASITELPVAMAATPYSLSVSVIGLTYLPQGIGSLIACPVAGKLSDYAAAAHPNEPESRLKYSTIIALLMSPPALLLYGWSLQYELHIAAAMLAQFFIGAGCSFYLPGLYSYLSSLKQSAAGAAISAAEATICVAAGILILVCSVAVEAMGVGPFFSTLAALQAVTTLYAYIVVQGKLKASGRQPARGEESP